MPGPEEDGGVEKWGKEHELFTPDIRNLNLGLVGDMLARAIRQAHVEDLLIQDDTRKRSLYLVVSSALPQPLLETVLDQCFRLYPSPTSISLIPDSVATLIASGLRSALIIDIDWHETTVTAVYEYREVRIEGSQRAGKRLSWSTAQMLQQHLPDTEQEHGISFEDAEEVIHRLAWCSPHLPTNSEPDNNDDTKPMTIPLPSLPPSSPLTIPFSTLSQPVESTFFPQPPHDDDHLLPLPLLIYTTLLHLPPDIRAPLLTRMIFKGPSTRIPGLKSRALAHLSHLLRIRGWDKIHNYGSALRQSRGINVEIATAAPTPPPQQARESTSPMPSSPATPSDTPTTLPPAHQREPEPDRILAQLQKRSQTDLTTHTPRDKIVLRAIKSAGPWAGASLLSGFRVRGVVEIERETFLAHGLAGVENGMRRSREQGAVAGAERALPVRTGSPEKRTVSGRPSSPEKKMPRQSLLGNAGGKQDEVNGNGGLGVWG